MKKIDKIFLFFISLICLAFSACILSLFYPIPSVSDKVADFQSFYPWSNYAFAIYCAVICLACLALLLISILAPNASNFISVTKDKGKLLFSKKSIESAVRYSFADLNEIISSRVKIKLNKDPEKIKIRITLSLSTKEMAYITESIQTKVSDTLQNSFGITVKTIMVKTTEFIPNNTVKKVKNEDAS